MGVRQNLFSFWQQRSLLSMGLLKKCINSDRDIVLSVIDATDIVSDSMKRLNAFPPSMVHLGQAMMAAPLLHSLWNEKGLVEKVALQWKVDGPFGHVFSESHQDGSVRGTILNPRSEIDNYDTSLGSGHLQVQKYMSRPPASTGIIEATGQVANDVSEYLRQSEQRTATLSLSVKLSWEKDEKKAQDFPIQVDFALGFLLDILPQETLEKTYSKLHQWEAYLQNLGPISEWSLPKSQPLDAMTHLIFPQQETKELLFQKVNFNCNCSEQRASRAASLSGDKKDLPSNGKEKETLEVQCEFCGKVYLI